MPFHHAINQWILLINHFILITLFSLFTSTVARLHNFFILAKSPSSAAHKRAVKTKSSLSYERKNFIFLFFPFIDDFTSA
jgi:hypothetical protein